MTRIRRTPAQIAADLATKAQIAADRAAMVDASANPALAPVVDALKRYQAEANRLKRSFSSTNPNSFGNRKRAFELRLEEIATAERLADAQLSDAEYFVRTIKNDLGDLSASLADGQDISDIVPGIVAGYASLPHIALEAAFDAAHKARKEYKASVLPSDDVPATLTAEA